MVARAPFPNGIRAFEAAARLGGFAAAAAELHVTPAAVSRMVKLLEARMGVALFERRANRLRLTEAGQEYRDGLVPLLDAVARLTERVAARGGARVLTVGVGPTFAVRWLIPRLGAFRRRAPDVEVRIATGGAAAPFSEDWTCGIRLGEGDWPGFRALPLVAADLTPVCARAMAAALGTPPDLRGAALLRVAHAPEDWPRWLAAAGMHGIAAAGPVLGFHGQAQQAALDGLGVALGLRPYIDDDIASGRLVAPFALAVPRGRWWLVHREAREAEAAFRAFRDWLTEEAALPTTAPGATAGS
jgi:LysR family glycine cleavage system transcriptional activator